LVHDVAVTHQRDDLAIAMLVHSVAAAGGDGLGGKQLDAAELEPTGHARWDERQAVMCEPAAANRCDLEQAIAGYDLEREKPSRHGRRVRVFVDFLIAQLRKPA
jgi:hypothetical protein